LSVQTATYGLLVVLLTALSSRIGRMPLPPVAAPEHSDETPLRAALGSELNLPLQSRAGCRWGLHHRISLALGLAALAVVALGLRVYGLGHLPGVNGDEAWYGNLALDCWNGKPRLLTPSRIPVNPFFAVPSFLLHGVFPPSVALLRVPALLSGLAALLLNAVLMRRFFGRTEAVISTTLLAVLPIMIAYSRFGWDTAQMPLATVLVMISSVHALRSPSDRSTRFAWLALFAGLIVHPTCLFLTPLTLLATLESLQKEMPSLLRSVLSLLAKQSIIVVASVAVLLVTTLRFDWRHGRLMPSETTANIATFLQLFADLFSGRTVVEYLSGAPVSMFIWNLWRLAVLVVIVGGLRHLLQSKDPEDQWLGKGLILGLLAFFVAAGNRGLEPGYERYGMILIVPIVCVWSKWLATLFRQVRPEFTVLTLIVPTVLLLQSYATSVDHIRNTGGTASIPARTGHEDTRTQAADLLKQHIGSRAAVVLTSNFHCSQPLQYLLTDQTRIQVMQVRGQDELQSTLQNWRESDLWIVDFTQDDQGSDTSLLSAVRGLPHEAFSVCDYAGNEVLSILHLTPAMSLTQTDSRD
jgi:hypothetical protein